MWLSRTGFPMIEIFISYLAPNKTLQEIGCATNFNVPSLDI